ncbi:MAG: glycosyltransferase family 4 protein [Chloroflexota bacterium]|nr:glycosyltransferase family 4 protein [Chloroflexota bacterium]
MSKPLRLCYVLNHGDSLTQWKDAGLLDLQLRLIRAFRQRGAEIDIVSHGGREELALLPQLNGMKLHCNWMGLPPKTYARRIHQLHAPRLIGSQLVQTCDAAAIVVAQRIAWAWRIPLVYRFGFVLSDQRRASPERFSPADLALVESMERQGARTAQHIICPTRQIAQQFADIEPLARDKTTVIPSAVDSENFRPLPEPKLYDLVYHGRALEFKNLWALLEAVERLDVTIAMIAGPLPREIGTEDDELPALKKRFGDLDGRIHWLGRMENTQLPAYLNRARVSIITSFSEGTARSLSEAMACGLPCIATRVPELKYMIEHEVNGYLCETDTASIEDAIKTVLSKPDMMKTMGENARRDALEVYSFEQLAQKEYDLLLDIARRNPVEGASARIAKYLFRRNPSWA